MIDWITVRIAEVKGSAPRGQGTEMRVIEDGQSGSIGGGRLEWEATQIARDMLRAQIAHDRRTFPLGPDLGQCCGGAVTLEFSKNAVERPSLRSPLWIWGAGHVGRALVDILVPTQAFGITWIDTAQNRFPEDMPDDVDLLVAAEPAAVVQHAPQDATHLILTYSHDIDFALCDGLLRQGFAECGLIGSATKWARFRRRLVSVGHKDEAIDRINCPIGNPALGKHPQSIAVGVAAQLLMRGPKEHD